MNLHSNVLELAQQCAELMPIETKVRQVKFSHFDADHLCDLLRFTIQHNPSITSTLQNEANSNSLNIALAHYLTMCENYYKEQYEIATTKVWSDLSDNFDTFFPRHASIAEFKKYYELFSEEASFNLEWSLTNGGNRDIEITETDSLYLMLSSNYLYSMEHKLPLCPETITLQEALFSVAEKTSLLDDRDLFGQRDEIQTDIDSFGHRHDNAFDFLLDKSSTAPSVDMDIYHIYCTDTKEKQIDEIRNTPSFEIAQELLFSFHNKTFSTPLATYIENESIDIKHCIDQNSVMSPMTAFSLFEATSESNNSYLQSFYENDEVLGQHRIINPNCTFDALKSVAKNIALISIIDAIGYYGVPNRINADYRAQYELKDDIQALFSENLSLII